MTDTATEVPQEARTNPSAARADAAADAVQPPAARRAGRGLASLALLLAILALSLGLYLYWGAHYEPDPLASRVAALEAEAAASLGSASDPLTARLAAVESELRAIRERQVSAAASTDSVPAENDMAADDARAAEQPERMVEDGASWQLAEVRYLLRMANHRLGRERDARGAALLLAAADDALRGLDDPRFTPVRARIAEERLAVAGLPAVDAEGLYLALEAIKRDLDQLPLDLPAFADRASRDASTEPPAEGWRAVWNAVSELVRVRRVDAARPLLAPEEAAYLELNLRLTLERAQLAGLRREQAVFVTSIETAIDWIEAWQEPAHPEVRGIIEGLQAIAEVRLDAPVPDLSGSLVALDAVLAGRIPAEDAPEARP